MNPFQLSLSALLAAGGLLISSLAAGQVLTHDYQVLIDVDRDAATGCPVLPTGATALDGFEHRLLATVEVFGTAATVISLDRQDCGGVSFGASQALTVPASAPYGAALDAGLSGSDSLELAVLRSEISAMFSTGVRLVFVADSGSGSDVLATTDGSSSGSAIVLGMPFDAEPIPVFTWWGIAMLLGAVVLLGWLAQRRMGRLAAVGTIVLVAGVAWAMHFMLDGDLSDWSGLSPNGQDVLGDATDGSAANDLLAGFAAFENETLYFRIDVVDMQNSAPSASADSYGTDEDTPLNLAAPGVLANDTDSESDPLTAVLDSGPANAASFTLNADGSFDYTPAADFNGSDSFTYHASDGQADSAIVTVTLTVNAVNDAPTVQDDTATTNEDVQVDIDVLANDSDIDGNLDPATVNVTTPPANGSTAINATTGVITYAKAADFNGSDSFVYEVCDDGTPTPAECASATVSVTIDAVNDVPVADSGTATTDEDMPVTVTLSGSDVDGDTLSFSIASGPSNGSLGAINQLTSTTAEVVYTPDADFNGSDAFSFTTNDGTTDSTAATVSITVNSVNDAPTAVDDSFTVEEDSSPNALAVLGNDTIAPDSGETLTVTAVGVPDQGGTAMTGGSSISYTPTADFVGTETFTYTIGDGNGGSDTATVTVTVNNTNQDAPVCTADSSTTDEDSATLIGVLANDADPDPGQTATLTISAVDTTGTTGSVTNNGTDVTYDPNGQFESLGAGDQVTDTFSYTAQDTDGLTCVATVTVTITGIDDPAVTANDTYRTVGNTLLEVDDVQDDPQPSIFVSGSVLDNDSDPDNTLSVSGTTNVTAGAVVNIAADGTFTYVPPAGLRGDGNPATADDSFDYQLTGGETATVSIDIDGLVWYVDNTANGGAVNTGTGTSVDRFSTLGDAGANADPDDAEDSSIAGDIVYVFQGDGGSTNQNAGYLMNDGERLLGEAVDLVIDIDGTPTTLFSGSPANRPAIGNASGDGVTVAADAIDRTSIEIRGLSIQGAASAIEMRASNTFSADAVIADNAFLDTGQAILDLNPESSGPFYATIGNNDFSAGAANSGHAVDLTSTGAANEINLAFDNNTGIASLGGAAVMLDNSSGGGNFYVTSFSGNSVRGFTVARGVVVQNAVFDADPSDPDFSGDAVVAGSLNIGSSVDPIGSNALDLINVRGDLDLGTLSLFANGSGLRAGSPGPLNAGAGTGFGVSSAGGTIVANGGPALDINGATVSLVVNALESSGSGTTGVSLTDVGGSLAASSGSITGSAGNAFQVASTLTSPLDITYGGTVTNSSGRLINLDGLPAGSDLLFNGSSLDDSGGSGIAVNDFDGVFTVTAGSTAISNSIATGFSATGDTDGTVNLDDVTITNSASAAISIVDGADRIGGSFDFDNVDVSQATNGARAVDIQGLSGGTVDFDASSALTATDGTGINVSSNAGTSPVRFFGTVDLGTSGARLSDGTALDFSGNSAGTTLIAADIDVFTAGQTAVNAAGSGTLDLDALSIDTASNGRALDLDGILSLVAIDTITCSHNTNCIDLTNLAATSLTGFAGVGLSCSGGTCFNASGARTVEVMGGGNTISATNAAAINLTNTTIGASGVTFESLSASGTTSGIVLDSTGSTGIFSVTGDGSTSGSGGTLQNITGDAITLNNTGDQISLARMIIQDIGSTGVVDSEHDAIHGATVQGGLILDGMIIRRISDMAIHGAAFPNGDSSTSWSGLTITDSTIENTNRYQVAGEGDTSDEGGVRIVGLQGTVLVDGNTFQNTGEHLDLFAVSGSLDLTATNNNFYETYKEFSSGSIASVGKICVDVTVQNAANANVVIGGAGPNTFRNCRIASVRVGNDAAATGSITSTVANNSFVVTDHSSGSGGDFDFPMAGLKYSTRGATSANFDGRITGNTFTDVTNADGGVGNVTLDMDQGNIQVLVDSNVFHAPGNAAWFVRANATSSFNLEFDSNTYQRDAFPCTSDPSCGGGYFGPGLFNRTQIQNSGVLDVTYTNEGFARHDTGFDPGNTVEVQLLNVGGGGTVCASFLGNASPDGYALEESAGDLNLARDASSTAATSCSGGAPANCITVLSDNGNTGGSGSAATSPPQVSVFGTVDIVGSSCTTPTGAIF